MGSMDAQAPGGGSPIPDGYKTPPCFPFPRRWNFDHGPVLAPDVVRFQQRLMVPNVHERLNSPDSEPCGNMESSYGNMESSYGISKLNALNDLESAQESLDSDTKQTCSNECDGLDEEPAGCSFEGPRKRSSYFLADVDEMPLRFRGETIVRAFKCIKMRKPT